MADNTMNEYPKKGLSQEERAEAEQNRIDGRKEDEKFEPKPKDKPDQVAKMDADITGEDLEMLGDKDQDMDGGDDETTASTELDDTDFDGDKLNEAGERRAGDNLDVPGSELDNSNEKIGEEDEENNYYSQSDNKDRD